MSPSTFFSDTEFCLTVHLGKVILKNRLRHVDRGEHVRNQTDRQRDGKSADRACSEKEQEKRRNDGGHVSVNNGQEGFVEACLNSGSGRLSVPQFFPDTF